VGTLADGFLRSLSPAIHFPLCAKIVDRAVLSLKARGQAGIRDLSSGAAPEARGDKQHGHPPEATAPLTSASTTSTGAVRHRRSSTPCRPRSTTQ
jgi:hypothetical protein